MLFSALPDAQGLYDPGNESDSCGVAMVTDIQGRRSHAIVADGLIALEHLEHRGAAGAEPNSGDGAGILIQLPVELLHEVVEFDLPRGAPDGTNTFAAGICFLPQDPAARAAACADVEAMAEEEELHVLGWRTVPVDPDGAEVGATALGCMPYMSQLFVATPEGSVSGIDLDRRVYPLRKRAERNGVYFPSLSSRTIVYKGMLTTMQLPQYFPDLRDERCISAIAIVHSRFSTNTFPSWPLAHPFRFVAHNGEINTVRGNRNRMHAREAMLASSKIPGELSRLSPICTPEASDSASFDEVLELLHLGGRSLPHAVLMMIPEAWENNTTMDSAERAFWQFHASLMEPWDGPACVTFTDGTLVGAVLDRNGLRPGRWWRTIDDRIILASESGVLDVPSAEIVAKGRLQPGKMFLIDTAQGRIVSDDEIKEDLSKQEPYGEWLHAGLLDLKTLPERVRVQPNHESVVRRQVSFGYTEEDLRILLTPMAASGAEPLGSMGTDTPTAMLSQRSRLLYDYFVELFAQVTNPPLDAIREEVVTSMARVMGPEQNLLELDRRVLPPDRAALARSGQRRAQQDRPRQRRPGAPRPQNRRAEGPLRRRTRRRGPGKTRSRISGTEPAKPSPKAHARWSSRTATPTTPGRRSRRCWPSRPCTTTWSAPKSAPPSPWSSKAVTPARCITSRCSSASAPLRSTRTWRSSPSTTSSAKANSPASNPPPPCATTSRHSARAS